MSWIEKQILELDDLIEDKKLKIITSITFDDLTRNGSCTKEDLKAAQNPKSDTAPDIRTRKKMKDVIRIAYDMVQNL